MAACLAAGGCEGGAESGGCTLAHATDITLVEREHAFYTTVAFNGQSAELLFDTGGAENRPAESAAHQLGLAAVCSGDRRAEGIAQCGVDRAAVCRSAGDDA